MTLAADDGAPAPASRASSTGSARTATSSRTRRRSRSTQPGRHTIQYRSTDDATATSSRRRRSRSRSTRRRRPRRRRSTGRRPTSGAACRWTRTTARGAGVQERPIPRRRRRVADLRRAAGRRGAARRHAASLGAVEAGRARAASSRQPDGSIQAARRPGDALVPGEGVRRLLAQAAVPRRAHRRRVLEQRRVRRASRIPDAIVALPSNAAARVRAARDEDRPEWVAIFCGQEIQMYDGPTGEPQKTGSIYNFQPLDIAHAQAGAEGRVVRLRGPRRRPAVHDHPQRRGHQPVRQLDPEGLVARGDPPTQARQFDDAATSACRTTATRTRCRSATCGCRTCQPRRGRGTGAVHGDRRRATTRSSSGRPTGPATSRRRRSTTFRIGTPPQGSPPPVEHEPPTFAAGEARGGRPLGAPRPARPAASRSTARTRCRAAAALIVSRSTKRKLDLEELDARAHDGALCATAGAKTVTLKPSRKAARALRRAHRRTIKAALRGAPEGVGQPTRRSDREALTLRR